LKAGNRDPNLVAAYTRIAVRQTDADFATEAERLLADLIDEVDQERFTVFPIVYEGVSQD